MHIDSPISFQSIFQVNWEISIICVSVSAPLNEIIWGALHGIKFESSLSQIKYNSVGFAFVDDTNIVEVDLTKTKITI